ncbi:MAG: hypothetical protein HQM13_03620 [SAR324 cluster bacterium]|nr:hypothetical protein [SAR324 cluster bacterium]
MKNFIARSQLRFSGLLLSSLMLSSSLAFAFDQEDPIPPSTWRIKTVVQTTPAYEKARGHSGKVVPLQDLIIRDHEVRKRIEGKLIREEKKFEFDILYGLTEEWYFSAKIPFWQKKQTSNLKITAAGADLDLESKILKIEKNLQTEEVQGLGDIGFQTIYMFSRSNSHFYRGALGVQLPTGSAGTPRGIFPIAIGDRQFDLLANLNYSHYPGSIAGLRQNFRGELLVSLEGRRETLDGQSGAYTGGNMFDLRYSLNYESDNSFFGGEIQHFLGTGSGIAAEQQDDSFFQDTVHLMVGYGNLSDLEKSPLALPFQIRLGWSYPFQGQNIPLNPSMQLMGLFYF